MSLYLVRIERTIIVDALSEQDALLDGQEHERDEAMNEPDFITVDPITKLAQVPGQWVKSRPYGRDDDLTVEQVLSGTVNSSPRDP